MPRRRGGPQIEGVRFLGGTLRTDFRLGSFSLTHAFRTAQGRDGMVDYHLIRTGPRSRDWIEPEEVLTMHRATTRAILEAELARPHDGPTVVATHHAPHPGSLADRHAHFAWCDASDLTALIEERGPDLLIHGQVYYHADYRVGRTRVVCNATLGVTHMRDVGNDLVPIRHGCLRRPSAPTSPRGPC